MNQQWEMLNAVPITAEAIDRAASSNGGFSRAQLALFGVGFPPERGWKKRLIGTYASREVVDEFIALKDKHLPKSRKSSSAHPKFVTVDFEISWKEQYCHPNWQKMRLFILNRDDFTCQRCGSHHRLLHVHHTRYRNASFIWDVDPATLTTLCEVCHSREHGRDLTAP